MKIYRRVAAWGRVLSSLLLSFGGIKGEILSPEETTAQLLNGRSLIRFGDGEFGIYKEKNIHYQKWSPNLKEVFEDIKTDYEADAAHCPYILAVPKMFMSVSGFRLLKKRVYVSSWSESRWYFKKNFRHNIPYGDSFLFEKKNKNVYSRIWMSEKCPYNVVFIHNSAKYAELFADTYKKRVAFVKCPNRDAFELIKDLEKSIADVISENGWGTKDVMLTISAGPAGKVLVYKLSKRGYWCIDAGHCWDEPLEGI